MANKFVKILLSTGEFFWVFEGTLVSGYNASLGRIIASYIESINVLLVGWWSSTVSPHLPHPPRPYFGVAAACSFTRRSSWSFFMRGCLARERARRCSRCTRA